MKKKSQRLQNLVRLAEHEETGKRQIWLQAQERKQKLQHTLSLLQNHKIAYQQELNLKQESLVSVKQIRAYHFFIARLDQACDAQKNAIQQAQEHCDLAQEQLQASHTRTRTLENARDLKLEQEFKQLEKQQQKFLDELAQRNPSSRVK